MLQSQTGLKAEAEFLRDVADGPYELVQTTADATRAADLVQQYSDLSLGTTDAIVIAIAERFRAVNIATQRTKPSQTRKTIISNGPRPPRPPSPVSLTAAAVVPIATFYRTHLLIKFDVQPENRRAADAGRPRVPEHDRCGGLRDRGHATEAAWYLPDEASREF